MTDVNQGFGSCWSCVDDVTMPSVMVTGNRAVAEAVARRWGTEQGQLIDDPNYGFCVADFLSDDLDRADIGPISTALRAEAEKDERVLSCEVTLVLNADGSMTVTGDVDTADGPFRLVVGVKDVNVTLLSVSDQ